MDLTLTSPSFGDGQAIAQEYTCDGADRSPPLAWDGAPAATQSFVLIVDDPDAPDPAAPKMTWVHWILFNLPPSAKQLPAGVTDADLPPGTKQGLNDWSRTGYGGPCPPIGRHRYFHKLYAIDTKLTDLGTPSKSQLEQAMEGHILAQAQLVGTYERSR
jgi:Raf kinase inhibitor-like YbhB/YbcL family protein